MKSACLVEEGASTHDDDMTRIPQMQIADIAAESGISHSSVFTPSAPNFPLHITPS